jgi:hypothetical protein
MNRKRIRYVLPIALVLGLAVASVAVAATHGHGNKSLRGDFGRGNGSQFAATLTGHQETPAVHTNGTGTLSLTINSDNTMSYTLTYSGLNSAAALAHIHFAQPNVAGGIVIWICGGGGKAACPAGTSSTATVTGTVSAADIVAPAGQGLNAGDLAGFVQEIRAGFAYVNVHTATSPAGEIRGQILAGGGKGHGGDRDDD